MKLRLLPNFFPVQFFCSLIFICFFAARASAQDPILIGGTEGGTKTSSKPFPRAVEVAKYYLTANAAKLNLTAEDVQHYQLQDVYTTQHNGLTHVIFIQKHQDIPLHNGILNVNVMPDGTILSAGNRFMKNLAQRVNATQAVLTPESAVLSACAALNIELVGVPQQLSQKETNEWLFEKGSTFGNDVTVKLCYERINDGAARLAYGFVLDHQASNHAWSVRVDALTGKILAQHDLVLRCKFHPQRFTHNTENCGENAPLDAFGFITPWHDSISSHFDHKNAQKADKNEQNMPMSPIGGGSYRVFPFPVESPAHGERSLVNDPADSLASPFGWHDVNGVAGAEHRTTRGNNAHAYIDHFNDDRSVTNSSPNGGASLVFDYPFLPDQEPDSNRNAAVTNLFFTTNMLHDITYRYGFDEAAGNFQQRNYSGAVGGNDAVSAEAQDSYKAPKMETDNANFFTPTDGSPPRMQMYVFSRSGDKLLHVTKPAELVGDYVSGIAAFGKEVDTVRVSGQVVVAKDGTQNPTLGCGELINTNLTGKIVLIDRGLCSFQEKALNAQKKGAIGVIIINIDENNILMGASGDASSIKIPIISVRRSIGDRLKAAAETNALQASIYRNGNPDGPNFLDGDFDNGIIAHEYAHGISNRLTGGRLNIDCLTRSEQTSGEGWSDFIALALTTRPTDRATTQRGMGTYVLRQKNSDVGIRRYPYSTDMKVNPLTYDDIIIESEVHNVGEVWSAALWDLYWAMVDLYGWDAKWQNTNSGNGRAIKLVMDGMKLQPCNPGFLEARDAILAADKANFNGANQCLIWRVFARRGMGFDAVEGSPLNLSDNKEGFKLPPSCDKALKIAKSATPNIKAGDNITYKLTASNFKGATLTNVVVTDELPQGTTYINGSASRAVTVRNGILTWNIGSMPSDTSLELTFRVSTDGARKSIAQFFDDIESGIDKWDGESLRGNSLWVTSDKQAFSGLLSLGVTTMPVGANDQTIYNLTPITVKGTQPVLAFRHKYDTQAGFDGGVVQISTNNGGTWENVGNKFFRNGYRGKISFTTFIQPDVNAFWGVTDSFIGSYIDLSSYLGKNIQFRFRFGSDSLQSSLGWFIDDVAVMDMYNYNSRARITSAQGDEFTADAPERGTIVNPVLGVSSSKEITETLSFSISPNPAQDLLNINILPKKTASANIEIFSTDGRTIWQNRQKLVANQETILPLSIGNYPAGLYIVKITTADGFVVEKLMKH